MAKKCRICNRILKRKECIAAGIGETCAKKLGLDIFPKKSRVSKKTRGTAGARKKKRKIVKRRIGSARTPFNEFQLLIPFKSNL